MTVPPNPAVRSPSLPWILLGVLLIAGCATTPPAGRSGEPAFYPLPPDEPRVQFLTSFSDSSDALAERSGFQAFILGKEQARPIVKPYGLEVWKDRLYLCDTVLDALAVLDLREKKFRYIRPEGAGRLSQPINVAIDADGTKYIADTGRGAVVILDAEDRYAGLLSAEEGMKPTDVAISADRLYVTDLQHHRVTVWDKAGRTFLGTIPREGEEREAARLFSPVNLALDGEGSLYVSDMGASRVQKYDRDGRFVRSFGSPGTGPGQMVRPKGIDLDDEGRLYVADAATEQVQIFDPEGSLLLFFGEPRGAQSFLSLPAAVRVDTTLLPHFRPLADPSFLLERLVLVSNQYGERKISVFGVGRRKQ